MVCLEVMQLVRCRPGPSSPTKQHMASARLKPLEGPCQIYPRARGGGRQTGNLWKWQGGGGEGGAFKHRKEKCEKPWVRVDPRPVRGGEQPEAAQHEAPPILSPSLAGDPWEPVHSSTSPTLRGTPHSFSTYWQVYFSMPCGNHISFSTEPRRKAVPWACWACHTQEDLQGWVAVPCPRV